MIAKLGITDDYGAYKNTFFEHQLCWAHPQRKLRDLVESQEFGQRKKKQIAKTYEQFSELYQQIRKSLGEEISPYLKRKWQTVFNQVIESHSLDPTPLAKIKSFSPKKQTKILYLLELPKHSD